MVNVKIETKINQILVEANKFNKHKNGIGMLVGEPSISMLMYFSNIILNRDINTCINLNNAILDEINQGFHINTFCNGIAGFGWYIEFLKKEKIYNNEDVEFLDYFDDYLYAKMMADLQIKSYDFLHGALGYAMYFLKRIPNNKCIDYLITLVDFIEIIVIQENNGSIKWSSIKYNTEDEIIYNISLSHGIASIINILVRIYKAGIAQEKCAFLIHGAIKYLLKQEIDPSKYNSHFSSLAIESEEKLTGSRLAWCYGDLGIAATLWQAGKVFNNTLWIDKAMEILKHSATRRDLKVNSVIDAGLCHGTAGIGHIFYRMWWNTRLPEFKEAADYWFDETLKMAVHPDGLAGYKAWSGLEGGWKNEVGLLEGIAGIGLALMTYHYEREPTWDECLLLS